MFAFSACGTGGGKPSGLMTEFIRHPEYVRILDNKPEFTWIIPDEAIKQTAYQIDRNPPGSIRYQRIELIIKSQLTSYQLLLPPNKRNTAPRAVQLHDSIGVVIPYYNPGKYACKFCSSGGRKNDSS